MLLLNITAFQLLQPASIGLNLSLANQSLEGNIFNSEEQMLDEAKEHPESVFGGYFDSFFEFILFLLFLFF